MWAKYNKKGYWWERIKRSLSARKCGIFETFDQLWKTAWRVWGWKWSLSGRLFWWEQPWWQMGQLNHCGNSVLDGWLWISGGHCVAVPMSVSCQRNLACRLLKSPLAGTRQWRSWRSLWSTRTSRRFEVLHQSTHPEHPAITKTAVQKQKGYIEVI